jgi:hypothetical protein
VDTTVADLAGRLGVTAAAGGHHLGYGTRNALLSLGSSYLEVIGPDEGQPPPSSGYWYGIENIKAPRLVTWTARVEHIERVAAHAHAAGYKLGDVHKVYRQLPNGDALTFQLTLPTGAGDGLVPNLIEWAEDSAHPAATAPGGIELLGLRGYHPVPESVIPFLEALDVDLEVRVGDTPRLVAILDAPYGPVELS